MTASGNPEQRPFLPFTRPLIDEDTIAGVVQVLRSGWITSGPKVKELEAKLSAHCGGRPVRAFNSGTCTMEIALRIAGVGPGHEVITTPLSWVATSNVILEVGARPVFVDIDPVTRNLDLDRVEAAITPASRALLPVDLAGLPVDRDRLHAIARRHGLRVVEDLLTYAPFRYEDRSNVKTIRNLAPGEMATVLAEVRMSAVSNLRRRSLGLFQATFIDSSGAVLGGKWFHGAYLADILTPGVKVALFGKVEFDNYSGSLMMMHPEYEILSSDEDDPNMRPRDKIGGG